MMCGGMMLGEIISKVGGSWSPVNIELFLCYAILDPVESHIHCFGFLLFDLFVGKTVCGGVVNLYYGVGGCGCPILVSVFLKGTPQQNETRLLVGLYT
jgi:hypothetical protein